MGLVPGDAFGPYRIAAELGRGGQAVVYRAEHATMQRQVALKCFDMEGVSGSLLARFRREAIAAGRLEHPNIVSVYDAGEIDEVPYLAMRLINGRSLAEQVRRQGPLSPERAIAILRDVAAALDFAHAHGVVHRDVTAANVLIDESGRAYLSDFGLVRLADQPGVTRRGDWMGTPEYLAPEIVEGGDASAASDRYAFACVAFEALTGRPPYVASSQSVVLLAHTRDQPPSAHALIPVLPPEVDEVFSRGLAKAPSARPASADALVIELERAINAPARRMTVVGGGGAAGALALSPPTHEASEATRDGWETLLSRFDGSESASGETRGPSRQGDVPTAPREPSEVESPAAQPWWRRRPAVIGAAAIVGLLLLAGGAAAGYFVGYSNAPDADAAREAGLASARAENASETRKAFEEGRRKGVTQGTARGRSIGKREGLRLGRKQGREQGEAAGYSRGYSEGQSVGYSEGRSSVFDESSGRALESGKFYIAKVDLNAKGERYVWTNDYAINPGGCFSFNAQGIWTPWLYCLD